MTVFAACLFFLAAFTSALVIIASWCRYGQAALALPAQLSTCPETLAIFWKAVERMHRPTLAPLRMGRAERPPRRKAPGLDWPGMTLAA